MNGKKMRYCIAAAMMLLTVCLMAGCGGSTGTKTKNGDKTLFTYDGKKVSFKEYWVYAKIQATETEAIYSQYFGENFWDMSIDGTKTMEDSVKESTVNQIKRIIVLNNRASEYKCSLSDEDKKNCEKYAKAFAEDQTGKTILEECGATEEDMKKIYEENTLAHKVSEQMTKDVNRKVSDDEARVTKVNRVSFDITKTDEKTGETKKLGKKKVEEQKKKAEKALKDLKSGKKTIQKIAEENEYTDSMEESYSAGESEEGKAFEKAIKGLKDGDILDQVIETDDAYVIAQLVAYTDKDGTKEKKESIISEREQEAFNKKYDEWTKKLEKSWNYEKDVDQELLKELRLGKGAEEATTAAAQPVTQPAEAQTEAPAEETTTEKK